MKRISARAIIVKDNKLLTMFRRKTKDGVVKEYYVIPGGGQDEGERLEDIVVRELREEMNVDIKVIKYLGNLDANGGISNYFYCEIVNGTPRLGGEELERMSEDNYYEPRLVDIKELDKIDISGREFIEQAIKTSNKKVI